MSTKGGKGEGMVCSNRDAPTPASNQCNRKITMTFLRQNDTQFTHYTSNATPTSRCLPIKSQTIHIHKHVGIIFWKRKMYRTWKHWCRHLPTKLRTKNAPQKRGSNAETVFRSSRQRHVVQTLQVHEQSLTVHNRRHGIHAEKVQTTRKKPRRGNNNGRRLLTTED